jgi:hypothetical protein
MITPGSFGAKRANANNAASAMTPTATVVHCHFPISVIVFQSTESVLPDGLAMPTTLGSWPIAM